MARSCRSVLRSVYSTVSMIRLAPWLHSRVADAVTAFVGLGTAGITVGRGAEPRDHSYSSTNRTRVSSRLVTPIAEPRHHVLVQRAQVVGIIRMVRRSPHSSRSITVRAKRGRGSKSTRDERHADHDAANASSARLAPRPSAGHRRSALRDQAVSDVQPSLATSAPRRSQVEVVFLCRASLPCSATSPASSPPAARVGDGGANRDRAGQPRTTCPGSSAGLVAAVPSIRPVTPPTSYRHGSDRRRISVPSSRSTRPGTCRSRRGRRLRRRSLLRRISAPVSTT